MRRRKTRLLLGMVGGFLVILTVFCLVYMFRDGKETKSKAAAVKYDTSCKLEDKYNTYYELLVYAFADSNGDGMGDFKGISEKLDYLKNLGVTALWLSPVNEATSYHGYDVDDYYSINKNYIVDGYNFEDLIKDCDKAEISIIMDLVINHTSNNNSWFLEGIDAYANDKNSKYKNFYNFSKDDFKDSSIKYITHSLNGIQYESVFGAKMPDLNYNNDIVINEMVKVAKYWMDKGVAGFRLDAVKELFKDKEDNIDTLRRFYKGVADDYPKVYMVGEAWDETAKEYYQSGLDSMFSFEIRDKIVGALNGSGDYGSWLKEYQSAVRGYNASGVEAYFLTNHDMQRIASEISNDKLLKCTASMMLLTPGNSFIYYGEEIGLKGERSLGKEYEAMEKSSYLDAAYRTPMYWNDKTNLTAQYIIDDTDKVVEQCSTISNVESVEEQDKDKTSLLNYYRKAVKLKNRYPALFMGTVGTVNSSHNKLISYTITYKGIEYLIVHNVYAEACSANISGNDYVLEEGAYLSADNEKVTYSNGIINLPSYSCAVLVGKDNDNNISVQSTSDIKDTGRFFVAGLNEEWHANDDYLMNEIKEGENTFVYVFTASKKDTIKVTNSKNWYGYQNLYNGTAMDSVVKDKEYDNIVFKEDGVYTVIFNSETKLLIINKNNDPTSYASDRTFTYGSEIEKIYVIGEFCNWMLGEQNLMTYDKEKDIYFIDISLTNADGIKLYGEDKWYASSCLDEASNTLVTDTSAENIMLKAGSYQIEFNQNTEIVTITMK